MAEKQNIIIKKKIDGGHGGAHGGAWKVAYADFVTAMMCFFLVMWLMGSDEETKQAVSHYFNHPNTPFKQGADPHSEVVRPLGEQAGVGDSVINGASALFPHDIIDQPRANRDLMRENKTLSKLIEDVLEGHVYGMDVSPEHVKFSLPESVLFKANSAELVPEAKDSLTLLGELLKGFSGYIIIEGHTDDVAPKSGKYTTNWELSLGRAVAVMNHFTAKNKIPESKMFPLGSGSRRSIASNNDANGRAKNRRVEFTLSYAPPSF